jgi:hypothetical protein
MAGGAPINDPHGAFLANLDMSCAVHPEWCDIQHHTATALVIEPNGEGLGGNVFETPRADAVTQK